MLKSACSDFKVPAILNAVIEAEKENPVGISI
jgi:hypothetical protein